MPNKAEVEVLETAMNKLQSVLSDMVDVDIYLMKSGVDSQGFMTAAYDGVMWWYRELFSKYKELNKES